MATLHRLTPQYILDRVAQGQTSGSLDAVCLFVDISGFTPLTNALMVHGTEGAEILAQVLAAVFEPLINAVHDSNGFVAGFAGDAFKALFPINAEGSTHECALLAAWKMRDRLAHQPQQTTRFGDFAFSAKVCAAVGQVDWAIWRDTATCGRSQSAAAFFGGAAIAECMGIDPHARAGEVVITQALHGCLPGDALATSAADDYVRVNAVDLPRLEKSCETLAASSPAPAGRDGQPSAFYPAWLLDSSLQGEFRQVVTLFVNFERHFNDDERACFQSDLFRLIHQYDGFLGRVGQIGGKDNGNTLLLFWGAPTGSERDVERALGFLLDLKATSPVRLRAGVTTHLAYAGFVGSPRAEEYTCYGSYVNLSARHMVAADWDEIWIDSETARQATRGFVAKRQGVLRFKGFADPQQVFLLYARQGEAGRDFYTTDLIGREAELDALSKAILPLFDGTFGGVVTVEGEAGLGKSRLVHELEAQTVSMTSPPRWFVCQTDDILRQPLNPFRYWLRRYFGQSREASERANRVAFNAALNEISMATPNDSLARELNRTRSFLAALVDLYWDDSLYTQLEPELRLENMRYALKTLVKAESLVQPVVLLLEDAHWLDDESYQFIAQLTRNVTEFPFVLLATLRPNPDLPALWSGDLPGARIALDGLSGEQVQAMVAERLGGPPSPSLVSLTASRANGNPFFVEQIVLYLRDHGLLEESESGWRMAPNDEDESPVLPTDVRALLTARLDRLAPTVKEVVQTAAVLGREFDLAVLDAMLATDPLLEEKVAAAGNAAIWTAIQETRLLFRHALLRDAAYDMQLRGRLRRLHSLAANAVQTIYAADLPPRYADLVHHYHHSEERESERTYAELAGDYAVEQYANQDAARYFERTLDLTNVDDIRRRYTVLLKSEGVYDWIGDRTKQSEKLAALTNLTDALQDRQRSAVVYLRVSHFDRIANNYPDAIKSVRTAIEHAAASGDAKTEAEAYHAWGRLFRKQNLYVEARAALENALNIQRSLGNQAGEADCLYDLAVISFYEGNFEIAFQFCDQSMARYEEAGLLLGQVNTLDLRGTLLQESGRFFQAQEYYDRALTLCRLIGRLSNQARILAGIGNSRLELGDFDSASAHHAHALKLCQEIGERDGEAISLDSLALIHFLQGNYQAAITHASAALSIQKAIGDRRFMGYTLTYLGNAAAASGDIENGEMYHRQALELRIDLGEQSRTIDNQAALAEIARVRHDYPQAITLALKSLRWMDAHGLSGIEFPVQVYLHCYTALISTEAGAVHRADACRALEAGHTLVKARADAIDDDNLREMYMQNIPFNREVLQQWNDAISVQICSDSS